MKTTVKLLNNMSSKINVMFDDNCVNNPDESNPEVLLLRSFDMHDYPVGDKLLAVGRAGAGVNNIPHAELAKKGVVVFNTPGANANAVAELTVLGMLMSARHVAAAINWAATLSEQADIKTAVEKGKKNFQGTEIKGKVLGLIGFGAIAKLTARAALALGMEVVVWNRTFYDSAMLEKENFSTVKFKTTPEEVFAEADYVSLHVPYSKELQGFVSKSKLDLMKTSSVLLNNARGELVNNSDLIAALENKKPCCYVTDFASAELLNRSDVIVTPHLGASTVEAEDNCALMIADQIKQYILCGTVKNSVNYPAFTTAPTKEHRLLLLMDQSATSQVAELAKSLGTSLEFTVGKTGTAVGAFDSDKPISTAEFEKIPFVYKVRVVK